ncbi:MAG TPA: GNAT family N-acetyltransferase [Vicinamibacterales bacterium]
MAGILADFSPASTAAAVEANLFSLFDLLKTWPRLEMHDDGACRWTLSHLPFPLFNSVVHARFAPDTADAAIEARVRACSDRNVPMLWWTGPSTSPPDLGERLERRGFLLEPALGMVGDIDYIGAQPSPAVIEVEPVCNTATLATWSRVLCNSFGAPQTFGDAFADLVAAVGLGPSSPFRHFLGVVNGEAVATCSLFVGAGVAGIYDVGTLPERRRQGIGAAITRAAVAEAAAAGYRIAILHSSALGAAMYRALGFNAVCAIGQYVWAPEEFRRYP